MEAVLDVAAVFELSDRPVICHITDNCQKNTVSPMPSYSRIPNQSHEPFLLPQDHDMFYRQSEPSRPISRKRRMRILFSYLPDWYVTLPAAVFLSQVQD